MTGRRFDKLPQKRRDEILELAARHFAESGFDRTSFNRILEELGIGKSSAYYYFSGKEDLFKAVLERCYSRYVERLRELVPPKDVESYWEFVREATVDGYRFMREDPICAQILHSMRQEPALMSRMGGDEISYSLKTFYDDAIKLGRALNAVRKDAPTELLVSIVSAIGAEFDRWFMRKQTNEGKQARLFVDVVRRVLEP